jgi:hypothetical protein
MAMRNRFLACSLLAGAGLLLASVPVRADPLIFDGVSDAIALYFHSTLPSAETASLESEETTFGSNPRFNILSLGGALGGGDHNMVGKATELLEPDGSVSDIFGVIDYHSQGANAPNGCFAVYLAGNLDACVFLTYSSDPAPFIDAFGGVSFTHPEGAGVFDATVYLTPGEQTEGFTAQFASDGDPTGVPEPGSLILFGGGLLALAAAFRKKGEGGSSIL